MIPAFAAVTVGVLPGFLTAAVAVQIRNDIDLTLSGLGVIIGIFFATAAVASAPAGALVERVGWPRGLRLAAVFSLIALAGVGWLARSTVTLGLLFVVGGLGAAVSQPAADLTIARGAPPERHGLLFGLKHAAVPAATLLGGLAVPTLALAVGWRWAFYAGALLAAAVVVTVPRGGGPPSPRPSNGRRAGRPTTALRFLVILAVAVGLAIASIDSLAAFVVSYAVDSGFDESAAALVLVMGSVAGIVTRVAAGRLIDRYRNADLTAIAAMLIVGALGVIIMDLGGRSGLVVGGLVAFAAGWGWSGLFTFAVVRDNLTAPAAATGITQAGKFLGAAVGPPVVGLLADNLSFSAAWWTTAGGMTTAAVLILYVRTRLPRTGGATPGA